MLYILTECWGCQHVKQEIKWDDLGLLEPTTWKSKFDDGTKLWEPYLNDGPRPPSPVAKEPWRQPVYQKQNPWRRSPYAPHAIDPNTCSADRELITQPPSTGINVDRHGDDVLDEDVTETKDHTSASGNAMKNVKSRQGKHIFKPTWYGVCLNDSFLVRQRTCSTWSFPSSIYGFD